MSSVRLIAITKPVVDDIPDTAGLLSYCARVSSTANQGNFATGGKLLRSLVKRREWSPFTMAALTIEIVTTRDISRQILRHKSFEFQEFSQRYAEAENEPVFREARMQHPTDRQMSIPCDDFEVAKPWLRDQEFVWNHAWMAYQDALADGVAKEVARAVLPEGLTPTKMFVAGWLRSWIHYVQLRCQPSTQLEHREIAIKVRNILCGQFPDLADVIMGETE